MQFMRGSEFSMYTSLNSIETKLFDHMQLNEFEGSCSLVPINIPISTYDNSYFPFDTMISVLFALATAVLLIVIWKFISANSRSNFSFSYIALSVYQLVLDQGFERESIMNRKEKLLMFGNMLLV